jgi:hypothetical protein
MFGGFRHPNRGGWQSGAGWPPFPIKTGQIPISCQKPVLFDENGSFWDLHTKLPQKNRQKKPMF